MKSFEDFLESMWDLHIRTGYTRPDTVVTSYSSTDHLKTCPDTYLTPEVPVAVEGRYLIGTTVLCPHGETGSAEFSVDSDLWILQQKMTRLHSEMEQGEAA